LFDTRERKRDTIRLRLHGGELCARPLQVLLRSLQVCAQATNLCIDPSDVNANGTVERVSALSAKSHTVFCTVVTSATRESSGSHLVPPCLDNAQVSTWPICRTSHVA
jgi:hypothetical protein